MVRFLALLPALLACSVPAWAQSGVPVGFEYEPGPPVVQGGDTLRNAWAGGFNTPQFSTIDLNGDGQPDLFAFDRESSRCYTFLSVAAPAVAAGRRWRYAPEYESLFPDDLESWALLRDYDCDGRADLFTYSTGGGNIRVFRNAAVNGRPSFQLTTDQIRYTGSFSGSANLLVGGYNTPAIEDVNGDGKLDIMTYDFASASFIGQYLNNDPGPCGSALTFTLATDNWGGLQACGGCAEYRFNGQPCFTAARPTHTGGHSLLLLDLDGDGDQDLLDGRDNCPELVRLLNQGTAQVPILASADISAAFPTAAAPARVPVFPAGYSFDADFDGRPDLVVAPNMLDNLADRVSLRNSVQLFHNASASGAPVFAFRPAGFLQNEMIDVSEGAAPTFGDLDGDGRPDMLVGNYADRISGVYCATLTHYRNVGTAAQPVFSFVTADYLGLAAQRLEGVKPVLVDLNRDGALDLAYAAWGQVQGANALHFILNTAPAGQPAVFSAASAGRFKPQGPAVTSIPATYQPDTGVLPYARGDMPCFTDVDNDGYVDLLIGTNEPREPGMSLRYFRNRGRGPLDSAFVLVDNDFGRIREAGGVRPRNLSPVVADFDGDGAPDLLTADATGLLRLFTNYRAQSGAFVERTDLLRNPLNNQFEPTRLGRDLVTHYGLAAADLNGDTVPELFVGTQAGGILTYRPRERVITAARPAAVRALALGVYPNPATATATVETAAPTRVTVFDLTGRVVRAAGATQRRHALSLAGLAAGVYLVRAEGADGAAGVKRLLVR
ncbi:T9SS type A sorting domain-containing protein [Hymenobacter sp.]|uniref:T9SS type A sorting domain-containing protein n=1 Tax=Hymenobacter sp. TaxID=1898978 RepID=UPI00286C8E7B|nr:T9SS type A sorting domain-containing protein [Hymenobacter sp.]